MELFFETLKNNDEEDTNDEICYFKYETLHHSTVWCESAIVKDDTIYFPKQLQITAATIKKQFSGQVLQWVRFG